MREESNTLHREGSGGHQALHSSLWSESALARRLEAVEPELEPVK